ncbi:hypothetical protein [Rhizobium sp. FKL33]|uniref:hypothetical protein n=1 Tax=Rhizobium sp. FKL33 TaxID=2562307 RepID=UPI0014859084|nr:hypothetical protein [Rhizobium sp. FKL33]
MSIASLLSLSLGRASPPQQRRVLTGLGSDGRRVLLTFASSGHRSPLFGKAFQ